MGVLLTAALIIVVYGPALLHQVVPGSGPLFLWKIAQWPAAALLLILALLGLYRFAPDIQEQKWKWLLPGSIVATVIWVAVSVLFKLYVRHFSETFLRVMGAEAANVHLGSKRPIKRILQDMDGRKSNWLRDAAKPMARMVEREWKQYRKR
jgi:hypothetical protein